MMAYKAFGQCTVSSSDTKNGRLEYLTFGDSYNTE